MSSPPPYKGRRGGDAGQPSRISSFRRRPGPYRRRGASVSAPPSPPVQPCPPSPQPSYADVVRRGLGTPPQSQHDQESGSASASDSPPGINIITAPEKNQDQSPPGVLLAPYMDINSANMSQEQHSLSPPPPDAPLEPQYQEELESGSELDSPPHITLYPEPEDQEPHPPTSPPGSPHPVKVNPTRSVTDSLSDEDALSDEDSLSDEEDPYFDYLVDKFVTAATDVRSPVDDEMDYMPLFQQRTVLYAETALKHYNDDEKNKIKYELICGITYCEKLLRMGHYIHVNFTAKGNQPNAKVELFFAELRHGGDTIVPTCVFSLEGVKKVGGLRGSKYDKFYPKGLPIDTQNCYACYPEMKHPKNGELYKMGHIAMSHNYFG